MGVMDLFGKIIILYTSYKGMIGKIADNKVKQYRSKTKCYTDTTEFIITRINKTKRLLLMMFQLHIFFIKHSEC